MTMTPADRLQQSVDDLAEELRQMRLSLAVAVRARRLAVVVGIIALLVLSGVAASNGRAIEANNRLLCPLIGIIAATDPPRTTPAGIQQQAEADRLKRSAAYDCP